MRKTVLYTLLSVDGVAEAPETFVVEFDAEMNTHLAELISTQDAVLLGRSMYDEWARYWPTASEQPFADFINGVKKYVVTSTAPSLMWANTSVVEGPASDFVRDLKSQEGGDIGIHGSIMLAQSLLTAGLIDELQLVVIPSVLGAGRRLFDDPSTAASLELIGSSVTPSGALLVGYRVTGA